ncbi:MAG: hypothetical protein ABSA57_17955 [Candidatus Acidiferrales bacterium]
MPLLSITSGPMRAISRMSVSPVDLLTGASAGGMSVAIIAQRLLCDGPSLTQPYDNPLYKAWVLGVDIGGLLGRSEDEDVTHSVLSSDLVVKISRYASAPHAPQPALSPDHTVHLGLALSNLNGVGCSRTALSGNTFISTRPA